MRKGENIRKRKDGRWEARYFNKDKQKYISVYAKSYTEVKEKVKDTLKAQSKKNTFIYIESAVTIWLSDVKMNVKQSTFSKYHDICNKHIIPSLGKIKLNRINQEMINSFIKKKYLYGRLDGTGGLSLKTTRDITCVLSQIMQSNKMSFEYKLPSIKQQEPNFLNGNEYTQLLNYLLLDTSVEKMGLLIALLCGLRLGELCALTWKDIDFENGTIHICKTIQRIKNLDTSSNNKTIVIIDTPKSKKSVRKIPIQSFIILLLENYKSKESYYILTGTNEFIEPRTLQNRFKKHLENCKVRNINFHALRHTFATKCMEKNVDMKTLSELLGHTDVSFTMNRYVHSSMEYKREQMEKLSLVNNI